MKGAIQEVLRETRFWPEGRDPGPKTPMNKPRDFFTGLRLQALFLFRFFMNEHPNLSFFVPSILHKFILSLSTNRKLPVLVISLSIIRDFSCACIKLVFLLCSWSCVNFMISPALRTQEGPRTQCPPSMPVASVPGHSFPPPCLSPLPTRSLTSFLFCVSTLGRMFRGHTNSLRWSMSSVITVLAHTVLSVNICSTSAVIIPLFLCGHLPRAWEF